MGYTKQQIVHRTWRETGPYIDYEIARQTTEFFADGREFEIITEEKFKKLLRRGKI